MNDIKQLDAQIARARKEGNISRFRLLNEQLAELLYAEKLLNQKDVVRYET